MAAHRSIAMFLYDGVAASDVAGPLECFDLANYVSGKRLYEIVTFSADGRVVHPAGSWVDLLPTHSFKSLPSTVDTIFLPGGPTSPIVAADPKLQKWLQARAKKVERVCSICTGAFILAASGLARDQRLATHWFYTEQLAHIYPETQVEPERLYVRSGNIWSSAGMTTGMDLALAMIETDFGRPLAMEIARFMVLYLRRSSIEPQFSMYLKSQFRSEPVVDRVRQWIVDEPASDLRVPTLAKRAGTTSRTLERRFKDVVGQPLGDFVVNARLRYACNLLEMTNDDLKSVATQSGLGSPANLRKTFVQRLSISPSEYRRRVRMQEKLPALSPKFHVAYDKSWIDRAEVKQRRADLRKMH